MNGEEFYEAFKDALDYLGVGFTGKGEVEVQCKEGVVILASDERVASFGVPREDE